MVAGDADGDVASAEAADDAVGLAGSQLGAGHVADIHRPAFAAVDDYGLHLLGRAKLAERPHDIPPLSFPEITARGVFILAGERSAKVVDRQLAGGELLRVDDHLELIIAAANQVGARHPLDPLQPAFDLVFRHPPHRLDVDRWRHQVSELGMLLDDFVEAEELEVGAPPDQHSLKLLGQLRVVLGGLRHGLTVGWSLAQHQPGDWSVVGVGGFDHWPVGVDWPVANLLHPRVGLHEHLVHIDPDAKLKRDLADRIAAGAGELGESFHAPQLLLKRLHNLSLDLLGAGSPPTGFDGDRGDLDFRGELNRHGDQREHAEQADEQHTDRNLHGVGNARLDEVHGVSAP